MKNWISFCKKTVLESKALMMKYLVLGIYMITFSILINRFELKELTYFNAVFSIFVFGEIIGYGISQAVAIYINQNIDDKKQVQSYVKLGIIATIFCSIVFTLLLFLGKDFLFSNVIVTEVIDQYHLFYLMIPAIFLEIIIIYFENILKVLKEFCHQLLFTIIKYGIIFLTMISITFFMKLNMYQVAILYDIVLIIMVGVLWYVLKHKTKTITLDLLHISTIPLPKDKKPYKTMLLICTNEIVWQIGYSLAYLFLLKKSELLYNSYNYFENVLDIFNGIYFSILNVASINICIKMGKGLKEDVYHDGKNTLWMCFGIWVIYFLLYLLLQNVIVMGMNTSIRFVGKEIGIMYLIIQLFRFIDWALMSYILILGSKIKMITILQIASVLYFLFIFLLAGIFPMNPILLIFIVGFDSFIKAIIGLWMFTRKKWIVKISNS